MDPVYAALFSWVLLGERLHPYPGFVGVALVRGRRLETC